MRKKNGSAIIETPGAMLLLFVFFLLPLFDMIALGLKYSCCYYLHQLQVREASLLPASLAANGNGSVKRGIPKQWKDMGLGTFVDLEQDLPSTEIRYEKQNMAANGVKDSAVVLSSKFRLKPFITVAVPFLPGIPGLNQALAFSMESKRLMENPGNVER